MWGPKGQKKTDWNQYNEYFYFTIWVDKNNSKIWELSRSETQEHFLQACIFNQLCTLIFSSLIQISWETSGETVKVVATIKTLNLLFILNFLMVIF